MKRKIILILFIAIASAVFYSFRDNTPEGYMANYITGLNVLKTQQLALIEVIQNSDLRSAHDIDNIRKQILLARRSMKGVDFWLRYLAPVAYKRINGPLPVEWETEVFEKFEKPYKREGAGLTLAGLYLGEEHIQKDSLLHLVESSVDAVSTFAADSITKELKTCHHFFLCNRLFLLNLAAIYTTGFECPDTAAIIPELRSMLVGVQTIYQSYNESFPETPLTSEYLSLYRSTMDFVSRQPSSCTQFDHFTFIKDYINPLFILNQKLINQYKVVSHSLVDYSLNKNATSIFDKALYNGQNPKGIFIRVEDTAVLAEIDHVGRLLFYDPVLSGNNLRSCASCHKSGEYLADTSATASIQYNRTDRLARNTPSLINAQYNHLLMLDGKHFTLQHQAKGVIANPIEMGCSENDALQKVLSCKEYRTVFKKLLKYTPQEKEITFDHIVSAITFYYSKFSKYYAPFDNAINGRKALSADAKQGFNVFMGKAQCGTCHFVPQFNGVKPPYVSSEFEVLGVPQDTGFKKLDADKGRYEINPASETMNAFRTGSIRNAAHTMPYMHNGVFKTLEQVIDFYDAGGGAGRGLPVSNQTLSSDSLKLTRTEKAQLIVFIKSLDEDIHFEGAPAQLPKSDIKALNRRRLGGEY